MPNAPRMTPEQRTEPLRSIVLGIDAGGSKTTAWAADAQTRVDDVTDWRPLAEGTSGCGNPRSAGFQNACSEIESAVRRALDQLRASMKSQAPIRSICLAAAGAGRETERQELRSWLLQRFPDARVRVTDDALPVLAAASPQAVGIALICGTGSYAWGRNADGATAKCGGWGALFGDEGSGYAIGIAALRAAAHAADGRGPKTLLLSRVLDELQIRKPDELIEVVYGRPMTRAQIASLSTCVLQLADQDAVAADIAADAALSLARMVDTLSLQLKLAAVGNPPHTTLALTGGVLMHHPAFRQQFLDRVRHPLAAVSLVPAPVAGAVRLALGL